MKTLFLCDYPKQKEFTCLAGAGSDARLRESLH